MRPISIFLALAFLPIAYVQAGEPFCWGVNGHPLSQEGYRHVPLDVQLDLVTDLGAGWYRFDMAENAVPPDELLAAAKQHNVKLLPAICSPVARLGENAPPEQVRAVAAAFAKKMAARCKGQITHWELSNELDTYALIRKGETTRSGKLWQWDDAEGSDPDMYEETRYQRVKAELQGLNEGIKEVDPTAKTMVDVSWLHYGYIERLVNEDHIPFDILAWHWYSDMGDITKVNGNCNLIDILRRFGKPIWITEANRRDGSMNGKEAEQAEHLKKIALQWKNIHDIQAVFVYELLDEPYFGNDGEAFYGFVEIVKNAEGKWQVGRKKPAIEAYRSAIAGAGSR
jgi:hypothetical protein